jgi:hypothetical protein
LEDDSFSKEGKSADMKSFSSPRPLHSAPLTTPVVLGVLFFAAIVADLDRPFPRLASSPRAILATPVVFRVVLSTAVLAHFDRPFPLLYHWTSRRRRLTGGLGGKLQARLPATCRFSWKKTCQYSSFAFPFLGLRTLLYLGGRRGFG